VDKITNKVIKDKETIKEIEDEVEILIAQAVEDYNLDEEVNNIVSEQIAQLDEALTVEFDVVDNQLTAVSASLDDVIGRMNALRKYQLGTVGHRISMLEELGTVYRCRVPQPVQY